jgi:hypothetical protein
MVIELIIALRNIHQIVGMESHVNNTGRERENVYFITLRSHLFVS